MAAPGYAGDDVATLDAADAAQNAIDLADLNTESGQLIAIRAASTEYAAAVTANEATIAAKYVTQ